MNPSPWVGMAMLNYTLPSTWKEEIVSFQVRRVGLSAIVESFTDASASVGTNSIRLLHSKYLAAGVYSITMLWNNAAKQSISVIKR